MMQGSDMRNVHELDGVGLGPANLALLGALVEEPHSPTTADIRFVERAATIVRMKAA